MVKVGDKYIFHAQNNKDYVIVIANVSDYREPLFRYAVDVFDESGYYVFNDYMFVDDGFISKCKKVEDKEI